MQTFFKGLNWLICSNLHIGSHTLTAAIDPRCLCRNTDWTAIIWEMQGKSKVSGTKLWINSMKFAQLSSHDLYLSIPRSLDDTEHALSAAEDSGRSQQVGVRWKGKNEPVKLNHSRSRHQVLLLRWFVLILEYCPSVHYDRWQERA